MAKNYISGLRAEPSPALRFSFLGLKERPRGRFSWSLRRHLGRVGSPAPSSEAAVPAFAKGLRDVPGTWNPSGSLPSVSSRLPHCLQHHPASPARCSSILREAARRPSSAAFLLSLRWQPQHCFRHSSQVLPLGPGMSPSPAWNRACPSLPFPESLPLPRLLFQSKEQMRWIRKLLPMDWDTKFWAQSYLWLALWSGRVQGAGHDDRRGQTRRDRPTPPWTPSQCFSHWRNAWRVFKENVVKHKNVCERLGSEGLVGKTPPWETKTQQHENINVTVALWSIRSKFPTKIILSNLSFPDTKNTSRKLPSPV